MFGFGKKNDADLNNPSIELFDKLSQKAKTQDLSVVKQYFDDQWGVSSYYSSGHPLNLAGGGTIQVPGVSGTKASRIANYRMISNYNEVGEAVDEIADAHMTSHSDGSFVKLILNGIQLSDIQTKEIQEEANVYFGHFRFTDNIYEYARKLTVEGELAFENIVDPQQPDRGIVDIRYLPTETYEFAVDVRARRKVGLAVFSDSAEANPDVMQVYRNAGTSYNGSAVRTENLNCAAQIVAGKIVFLPFEQVTYINSGIYDQTGLIVYPALERARRAYNQLQLIEDAVLIYRWVRSPVRNVFSVDCGKMPPVRAKEYVRELSKSFSSKRSYDPATGSIVGTYDPFTIMENVWIPKSAEGTGVSVSQIGGQASWGQLEDLDYFLKKLYRALKVPASRMLTSGGEAAGTRVVQYSEEITYEEYRFAKYIVRSLACFSRGLKEGLITHLKLTGAWQRHGLSEHNIMISIAPPAEIEIYRRMKLLDQKLDLFGKWVENGLSAELGKERILGFSQPEIAIDRTRWENEQIRNTLFDARIKKVAESGQLAVRGELEEKIDQEIEDENEEEEVEEPELQDIPEEEPEDDSFVSSPAL